MPAADLEVASQDDVAGQSGETGEHGEQHDHGDDFGHGATLATGRRSPPPTGPPENLRKHGRSHHDVWESAHRQAAQQR